METIADTLGSHKVQAGKLIVNDLTKVSTFLYLQSGKVAVYGVASGETNDTPYYLYTLSAPAIIGLSTVVLSGKSPVRMFAETDCTLLVHNGNKNHLLNIFQKRPNFALLSLRSIYQELNSTAIQLKKGYEFSNQIARVLASSTLALTNIIPQDELSSELLQGIYHHFTRSGGSIPEHIDGSFLLRDLLAKSGLEENYELPFSLDDFVFLKNLVILKNETQLLLAKENPTLFFSAIYKAALLLHPTQLQFIELLEKIETYRLHLFEGDFSLCERISTQVNLAASNSSSNFAFSLYNIADFFRSSEVTLKKELSSLWRIQNPSAFSDKVGQNLPALKELADNHMIEPEEDEDEIDLESILANASGSDSLQDDDNDEELQQNQSLGEFFVDPIEVTSQMRASILNETHDLVKKIMEFANISEEEQTAYEENAQKFMSLEDPFSSDSNVRKIRRSLNNFYWQTYQKAILRYLENREELPQFMKMFFNFGIFDDRFLDESQLLFLYSQGSAIDQSSSNHIVTLLEWLTKIYDKEVPTSLNDLGLTFFEILRQENRDAKWRRESDLPDELNTGEARLKFEMNSMVETTTKLCSGAIINHIAPLTRYSINRPLERSFVNKERMEKMIENLLNLDFSAYHREVLYTNEEMGINREFIQVQVIPNIILMPTAGHIFQFWQEREGRDRMSPGRLTVPAIATEDLFHMLLKVTGAYRWEMTKTIMGVDWNNVSQSSLTADYTDYVQFFRKNRDLSIEVKEKLHAEFKRFRDDRSRFTHDYSTWVLFESEGRQKLNKVVRKILAKHIPFAKPVREDLLKLPMFIDPVQRSINLRKKKARDLEPRYKRYRNINGGVLPEDLEANFDFYNMEVY